MKKLYGKGKVHPSPALEPVGGGGNHLELLCHLPATILALTAALSAEDREVLAYLISSTSRFSDGGRERSSMKRKENKKEHPPLFHCTCFRCYMSFWVRWDSSPNRQLIHEILDVVEASLDSPLPQKRRPQKRAQEQGCSDEAAARRVADASAAEAEGNEIGDSGDEEDKGSVRRFMSFIGDKIWGVWN